MDAIKKIREKARGKLMTIVLPEYEDKRMQEAARIIEAQGIANAVLLSPDKIDEAKRQRYIKEFCHMHKAKAIGADVINRLFEDTLYTAAMMTREGEFDGLIAGAAHTTPDMARAAIRCIGIDEHISIACSSFIMVFSDCPYADQGVLVFADCGIIPEPTPRQIACISLATSELVAKVLDITPRIALLSYSTKSSAKGRSVDKVVEALKTLKEMAPDLLIDGEMQADAAIVPEVAAIKYPDSPVAGRANILIFPSLESGNISYKLVERLGRSRALGPLLMGLKKPCSDLSRGCSVEDIVDCAAVTAVRAQ